MRTYAAGGEVRFAAGAMIARCYGGEWVYSTDTTMATSAVIAEMICNLFVFSLKSNSDIKNAKIMPSDDVITV